jgi:hypothetical protein
MPQGKKRKLSGKPLPGQNKCHSVGNKPVERIKDRESAPETQPSNNDLPSRRVPGQIRTPPPALPPSLPSDHPLIPPHTEDPVLRDAFDLHIITVCPSSKIEAKVRRTISLLKSEPTSTNDQPETSIQPDRPVLVALVARAPAANKCISVAEIAKRELLRTRQSGLYQYTTFWVRLEEMKTKASNKLPGTDAMDVGSSDGKAESDVEEDFDPVTGVARPKLRNIPCLLIYLSKKSIPKLQSVYR